MDTTLQTQTNDSAALQRDALIGKMLEGMTGLVTHYTIYLGDRLGFYDTLARHDGLTSPELATLTGTNERYTREWLEQQTVYGILLVQNAQAAPKERRFTLPEGHAEVLTSRDSLNYLAPFSRVLVAVTQPIQTLLTAFRSGEGVPFEAYGNDMREGQASINRAAFLQELGPVWITAMEDVHRRLQRPGARIADIGCGYGWSSIGMAQTFPQARIDAFDLDKPSIDEARKNAIQYGVSERVNFQVHDAADPQLAGHYDLVTALECVHDMSDPVGALRTMRRMVNGAGSVLIVDERVGETFTPEGNDVEAMMYGWSVLHCLPVGMAEQPSAATGTVMRPDTLRQYAYEAGFREVEILPVENFFFHFYRLIP
jgi:2-polyprenyl-3-methyl-5-hydroxy-6-metoxy-1,4-benzoquinol methylase